MASWRSFDMFSLWSFTAISWSFASEYLAAKKFHLSPRSSSCLFNSTTSASSFVRSWDSLVAGGCGMVVVLAAGIGDGVAAACSASSSVV